MSWEVNDLLTDTDLQAYEGTILSGFGKTNWREKRSVALNDWLVPILRTRGFNIERLRTRYEPDNVQSVISGTYADIRGAAIDQTSDDINLASVFATVGTDALYVGSTKPFRGLSIRVLDAVSAISALLTVSVWTDRWESVSINDGTQRTPGKSFSAGGAVTWDVPTQWVRRPVNGSDPLYFVKLTMSATPTSAKCGQIGVIRRSALCGPLALRTLALIMWEAPTGADGPWETKAARYETEADAALQRALEIIGGEFEADDTVTDQIDATEAAQSAAEVSRGPHRLERG